jgi:fructose-bisphosphate aldolase class I
MTDYTEELIATANRIAHGVKGHGGVGILAADESTGTIAKRFEGIKVENTEVNTF